MQLRTRVIGAAGIAAVVAAGGFAFTDKNTVPTTLGYGYGQTTVEGGIVTSAMALVPDTNDASKLGTVTYATANDISAATCGSNSTAYVSVNDGDLSVFCPETGTSPNFTITCTTDGLTDLSAVHKVALTVKTAPTWPQGG